MLLTFHVNLPEGLMEQNKMQKSDKKVCDSACFGMEIYVFLSQSKSPLATVPDPP